MLILFGLCLPFFLRAAKIFQLALLLTRSLTIFGTAGVYELIACVRRANENAGNLISVVQFLRILFIIESSQTFMGFRVSQFPLYLEK